MPSFLVNVAANGKVVLPAHMRQRLKVAGGGTLVIQDDGEQYVLLSTEDAVRRVQALVRKYAPDATGVVDEFLAERRAEVEAEDRS